MIPSGVKILVASSSPTEGSLDSMSSKKRVIRALAVSRRGVGDGRVGKVVVWVAMASDEVMKLGVV